MALLPLTRLDGFYAFHGVALILSLGVLLTSGYRGYAACMGALHHTLAQLWNLTDQAQFLPIRTNVTRF
jgi:hypothetical protein